MKFFKLKLESNLSKRVVSGIILICVILLLNYIGGFLFKFVTFLVLLIGILEGNRIIQDKEIDTPIKDRNLWSFFGLMYIIFAFISFICIRDLNHGANIIFYILCVVWATDVGAYAAGNIIGGPKIFPKISPNKKYSGCIGGIILSLIAGLTFSYILCGHISTAFLIYTCIISVVAQVGDFFESFFKRKFNVKDSGDIIPGHGGVLDRIDSLLAVSIVYWVILEQFINHLLIK